MAEQSKQSGFGMRLLIIIFGLGIVTIGAYPLKKEYGSIFEYLAQQSTAVAGALSRSIDERSSRSRESRVSLPSTRVPPPRDHLTEKDRKELNNLLENIE